MGILVNNCCGCFSLRTGTLIIGYFQIIISFISSILIFIASEKGSDDNVERSHKDRDEGEKMTAFQIFIVVINGITIIVAIVLIIGVYKNKPGRLIPWIVAQIIGMTLTVINIVMIMSSGIRPNESGPILGPLFIRLAWGFYFVMVVLSYQKAMKRETHGVSGRNVSNFDKYETEKL